MTEPITACESSRRQPSSKRVFHGFTFLGGTQQDGSTGDDRCYAMAAGSGGRVILAGDTQGSWGATALGDGYDFVAVALETLTVATPAPSAGSTPAPFGEERKLIPMSVGVVSADAAVVFVAIGVSLNTLRKFDTNLSAFRCWTHFVIVVIWRAWNNVSKPNIALHAPAADARRLVHVSNCSGRLFSQ